MADHDPLPGPDETLGAPCRCGCENFQRVVVERVVGRRVITDLVACVECRLVYFVPLPPVRNAAPPRPAATTMTPGRTPGMMRTYGTVPGSGRREPMSEDDVRRIKEAAARANKSKPKR